MPPISINICRPTLRGVAPETAAADSWFPLWMLKRHFDFQEEERPDFLFYGDVGKGEHLRYPSRTIRIFLTGENIPPDWKEADYALTHERIWNERHWRAPLWRHFYDPGHTILRRDLAEVRGRVDRFCNFIYSNERARERIEFFQRLHARKPVDSGGGVLNNLGGRVADKLAYLARCKFTIAFENESHPGYATEKIIEPLLVGSIPIYWGDPQIEEDFNPDCLINAHRFPDFDAVIEEVLRIDADDSLWEKYVTAPIFRDGRMPENLTDGAYVHFFERIVRERRTRVPRWRRIRQRAASSIRSGSESIRAASGVDLLRSRVRPVARRIRNLARKR